MPFTADVIEGLIDDGDRELSLVRKDFESRPIPPPAEEILDAVARGIDHRLMAARASLSVARAEIDIKAVREVGDEALIALREVQGLVTMVLVAEAAMN